MDPQPTVFVVDDDDAVLDSLALLLESEDLPVQAYASAEAFLQVYDPKRPGCLVLDIRMPGMSGLELQATLAEHHSGLPVIFITGHADVPASVKALKGGAVDFLEKPFEPLNLLKRIREAIALDAQRRQQDAERSIVEAHFARLTPREREIMAFMVADKSSKEIAAELEVSYRTVQVHRSRVMQKMEAHSLLGLATMASICGIHQEERHLAEVHGQRRISGSDPPPSPFMKGEGALFDPLAPVHEHACFRVDNSRRCDKKR